MLEWLGAHLLAPLVNLYRAIQARPRPDVRIVELTPTGGGTHVEFNAFVQNYGTQPARVTVAAQVGDQDVHVAPRILDLLVNAPPLRVAVYVPRPELGDLVPEFNNETTLYGRELEVRVKAQTGKHEARSAWHELLYNAESERVRHEIQQRVWRLGRGEDTEADRRADWLSRKLRERDEE